MSRSVEFTRVAALALALCVLAVLLSPNAQAEVFFLRDGSCVAGSSPKPIDDHFVRLQTLQGHVDIDRSEILIHRSDMELNTLFKNMRAELTPGSSSEMSQLAWWCRTKGLYSEMFDLLDRVAAIDPLDGSVEKFVGQMVGTIDYGAFRALSYQANPAEVRELLRASAKAGPTLARIGEGILSRVPEDVAAPVLVRQINSGKKDDRHAAMRVCRTMKPQSALEPLIRTALFDRSDEARGLALDALSAYNNRNIINPFVTALRLESNRYRMNALDGLERLNDQRVSGVLISGLAPVNSPASTGGIKDGTRAHIFVGNQKAAVTGFDTQIAQSAAIANPVISTLQEGVVLDVKIFGVAIYNYSASERRRIGKVLTHLNGVDHGMDVNLWKEWWDRNKKKILAAQSGR